MLFQVTGIDSNGVKQNLRLEAVDEAEVEVRARAMGLNSIEVVVLRTESVPAASPAAGSMSTEVRPRVSFGCSLAALAVTAVGGIILIFTPQAQHRWLTPRIVLPIWGLAGLIAAVVFITGKRTGPDPYARGLLAGGGTVLLCLLALAILFLVVCTGLVSGPMHFR